MSHIDGNALAGPLSELFEFDPTTTSVRCSTCSDIAVLARAMVYEKPHSFIVRCSSCDAVLMVVIHRKDVTDIDLSGVAAMSIPNS